MFRRLAFGKAFLVGLGVTTLYFFGVYDNGGVLEAQIAMATSEITANKNEVESVRKAIEDAERYRQTMAMLGAEMERVLKAIPAKLDSLELMRMIANEAKGVGAEINQVNSPQNFRNSSDGTDGPKPFYENVPIEINIAGTYNQIMIFLSNLTRLDKIITSEKMSLSVVQSPVSGRRATVPTINLKASLQAYRYLSEKTTEGNASGQ